MIGIASGIHEAFISRLAERVAEYTEGLVMIGIASGIRTVGRDVLAQGLIDLCLVGLRPARSRARLEELEKIEIEHDGDADLRVPIDLGHRGQVPERAPLGLREIVFTLHIPSPPADSLGVTK